MDKPTRGQWRGYAILCGIFLILLLLTILWPMHVAEPEPLDNSELAEAVARYGETIVEQERSHTYSRRTYPRDTVRWDRPYAHERTSYSSPYDTLVVDINTADTARLRLLRGIGPVFAARIVKYRSLLGGFVRCSQLLEVYGMDEQRYASIEPHIVASTDNVVRIAVNSATLDELRRHPYLDYYQARAIVDYRNTVGPIRNADDLLKINLIDDTTARKIIDYIQFN